jgi:hypothetical protein
MNAPALVRQERPARQYLEVQDPIPVFDTGHFEHMQRIATVMARSPLIPETLQGVHDGTGANRKLVRFSPEQVLSNCFLITNQALRWGLDPFGVAQCCSVVHGRLMYEGKLVAAVLDAKLGTKLEYHFNDRRGDEFGVLVVGPSSPSGAPREVDGTVGQWKTTGNNSPWGNPANHKRQLVYRGTREWARVWEPALLLGVYTPDELESLQELATARRAAPVTSGLAARLSGPGGGGGFNAEQLNRDLNHISESSAAGLPQAPGPADEGEDTGGGRAAQAGEADSTSRASPASNPAMQPEQGTAGQGEDTGGADGVVSRASPEPQGSPQAGDGDRLAHDDPKLEKARQRGRVAAQEGAPRKVPSFYKDGTTERYAWLAAYDTAERELAKAGVA